MANANSPFGLIPKMYANGSPWTGKFNWYSIPVGNATALFIGDAVKLASSATADGKYPDIVKADDGDATFLVGVVIGFATNPELGFDIDVPARKHCPVSTAMYAAVVDDPDVIFEIQEDSAGAATVVTSIGENADIVYATGSTTTGVSGTMLDSSDHKTATAQLRILRLVDRPDNALGNYAKWLVKINEHVFASVVGA